MRFYGGQHGSSDEPRLRVGRYQVATGRDGAR